MNEQYLERLWRKNHWRNKDRDFKESLVGGDTTLEDLQKAIIGTKAKCYMTPGFDSNNTSKAYLMSQQNIDCDEVYPNIFIGDRMTATNKTYLKMIGVTHVLNAACGNVFGCVNTNKVFYADVGMKFLGLHLIDLPTTNISQYFSEATSFIEDALSSGGKVFVHCLAGVSRSATCVLAFLMIKRGMSAVEAIKTVRQKRNVYPNEGFLRQLADLDNQLRRSKS